MKKPHTFLRILLLASIGGILPVMPMLQADEITEEPTVKKITFLGVESYPISGALRAQLDIPKGMGLSVGMVVPDSAAEEAGLQQHDILMKFEDQWLVNSDQLAALIRSHEAGDTISLSILRKGEELTLDATLGSHEVKNRRMNWISAPEAPFAPDMTGLNIEMDELQEHLAEFKERAREMGNVALEYVPEIIINKEMDNGGVRSTSINMGNRSFVITDDKGTVKMSSVDGETTIKVLDPDDKVLYEGEKPDEEALKELSPEVQERILLIEEQDKPTSLELLKQLDGKDIKIIINTEEEAMIHDSSAHEIDQHG